MSHCSAQLGETALMVASGHARIAAMQALIAARADVSARDDVRGRSVAGDVLRAPHLRLHARMVCCRTASLGRACAQNGWTVVIWAVKENKPEALMILLEAGAPKDAPDTVRAGSLVCSLACSWV